ncbi:MAG: peptidase inhibitor family I36 protein [Egibacteraceae bacterium]
MRRVLARFLAVSCLALSVLGAAALSATAEPDCPDDAVCVFPDRGFEERKTVYKEDDIDDLPGCINQEVGSVINNTKDVKVKVYDEKGCDGDEVGSAGPDEAEADTDGESIKLDS